MAKLDLHCHTTASDGALPPAELVARAAARGSRMLAVTDHDCTAGLALARQAAEPLGLDLINGVEISVSWQKRTVHIVGLDINPDCPALAASWLTIHMVFAFRYAHRYYQAALQVGEMADTDGPGLKFPCADAPDYFDFMYYAYVVGMTSQVSDVQVTSREMRRLTLVHGILSFGFNMLVLALSINVVAGAVS